MRHWVTVAATLMFAVALPAAPAATGDPRAWVAESDANAAVLLQLTAKYSPESATGLGLAGYEGEILDLSRDRFDEYRADYTSAIETLRNGRAGVSAGA